MAMRNGPGFRPPARIETSWQIYKVASALGRGSFGEVYRGTKSSTGDDVALKFAIHDVAAAEDEIGFLASLGGRYVVELWEYAEYEPQRIAMVMELAFGDLKHSRKVVLGNGRAASWQLASGLRFIHSVGVIHGDLKPANCLVFLDEGRKDDFRVKLCDFSCSYRADKTSCLTLDTSDVVTLPYRPPELLLGLTQVHFYTDIWSYGIIVAELMNSDFFREGGWLDINHEYEVLIAIFQKLGTPNESTWHGVSQLPNYSALWPKYLGNWPSSPSSRTSSSWLALVRACLVYAPGHRASASVLENHEWFQTAGVTVRHFPWNQFHCGDLSGGKSCCVPLLASMMIKFFFGGFEFAEEELRDLCYKSMQIPCEARGFYPERHVKKFLRDHPELGTCSVYKVSVGDENDLHELLARLHKTLSVVFLSAASKTASLLEGNTGDTFGLFLSDQHPYAVRVFDSHNHNSMNTAVLAESVDLCAACNFIWDSCGLLSMMFCWRAGMQAVVVTKPSPTAPASSMIPIVASGDEKQCDIIHASPVSQNIPLPHQETIFEAHPKPEGPPVSLQPTALATSLQLAVCPAPYLPGNAMPLALANRPWLRQLPFFQFLALPHQQSVVDTLRPHGASKLLIWHPVGAGKTFTIIKVFENFKDDPRAKLLLVPSQKVAWNFYKELLRFPNHFRDVFANSNREIAMEVAAAAAHDEIWDVDALAEAKLGTILLALQECLELKKRIRGGSVCRSLPGMSAPLRAITYARAERSTKVVGGVPVDPLMKIGFHSHCFDNKVVMMDEGHNLLCREVLRDELSVAEGLVLGAFTATPYMGDASECHRLMSIVSPQERLLSYVDVASLAGFPRTVPAGVHDATCLLNSDAVHALVERVKLDGDALRAYVKRKRRLPHLLNRLSEARLASYTSCPIGNMNEQAVRAVLASPGLKAPKIVNALELVRSHGLKSVIVASGVALRLCLRVVRDAGVSVTTVADLQTFNSKGNSRGELCQVCVLDSKTCGEGISLRCVRHLVLLEIPKSSREFIQWCGRAIRLHSHADLPPEEQSVRVTMLAACVAKGRTVDQIRMKKLLKEAERMVGLLQDFRNTSRTSLTWPSPKSLVSQDPSLPSRQSPKSPDPSLPSRQSPKSPVECFVDALGMVVDPYWGSLLVDGDENGNFKTAEVRSRLGMLQGGDVGSELYILQCKTGMRVGGRAVHNVIGQATFAAYEFVSIDAVGDYQHETRASFDDVRRIYPKAKEVCVIRLTNVRRIVGWCVPALPGFVGWMPVKGDGIIPQSTATQQSTVSTTNRFRQRSRISQVPAENRPGVSQVPIRKRPASNSAEVSRISQAIPRKRPASYISESCPEGFRLVNDSDPEWVPKTWWVGSRMDGALRKRRCYWDPVTTRLCYNKAQTQRDSKQIEDES